MAQVLGSLHPCGDPEEFPGSQLQTVPALARAAIWGINQQVDFCLRLCVIILSEVNKD